MSWEVKVMTLKENLENLLEAYADIPPCPNCGSHSIVNVYDDNGNLTLFDACEDCGEEWEVE